MSDTTLQQRREEVQAMASWNSIPKLIERLEVLMCRCENNGDYCEACALLAGLKEVRL